MVKITFNYLLNKGVSKLAPALRMKVPKIYIFAPQRTFSNYFENFLQNNFIVNLKNSTNEIRNYDNSFHKHIFKPDLDALKKEENSIIFILYKNFSRWKKSLEKNDQDFFDQFLVYHKKSISREDSKKLKEYHDNWYNEWTKLKKEKLNIEFIHQDQTLTFENNKNLFLYLKKKYSLISKGKVKIPKKIPRSKNFDSPLINNQSQNENDSYEKLFKII